MHLHRIFAVLFAVLLPGTAIDAGRAPDGQLSAAQRLLLDAPMGACGAEWGQSCTGSNCCSEHGFCGTGPTYCNSKSRSQWNGPDAAADAPAGRAPEPVTSPSTQDGCGWAGHCEGAACLTKDDCGGQLICINGACGVDVDLTTEPSPEQAPVPSPEPAPVPPPEPAPEPSPQPAPEPSPAPLLPEGTSCSTSSTATPISDVTIPSNCSLPESDPDFKAWQQWLQCGCDLQLQATGSACRQEPTDKPQPKERIKDGSVGFYGKTQAIGNTTIENTFKYDYQISNEVSSDSSLSTKLAANLGIDWKIVKAGGNVEVGWNKGHATKCTASRTKSKMETLKTSPSGDGSLCFGVYFLVKEYEYPPAKFQQTFNAKAVTLNAAAFPPGLRQRGWQPSCPIIPLLKYDSSSYVSSVAVVNAGDVQPCGPSAVVEVAWLASQTQFVIPEANQYKCEEEKQILEKLNSYQTCESCVTVVPAGTQSEETPSDWRCDKGPASPDAPQCGTSGCTVAAWTHLPLLLVSIVVIVWV